MFASLLAASLTGFTLSADGQPPTSSGRGGRAVAVTFDDLPAQGDLPTMRDTTTKLLGTLAAERIPATGFVNESKLTVTGEVEGSALLSAWLDAGCDLGN